jgi:hypothetical protein
VLVNPLLGVDRRGLRDCLRRVTAGVQNLRGRGGSASDRLIAYLVWASEAAGQLGTYVRAEDVDRLIFARHHQMLLAAAGMGTATSRVVGS